MFTNLVRENRRTLSIVIDKKGEMQVKAPKFLPLEDIIEFIKSKERWITSKQSQVKSTLSTNKEIIDYNQVLYLGNKLECVFLSNIKDVEMTEKKLLIPQKFYEKKAKYISKWLKNKAFEVIENRVFYFATNYKLKFKSLALINSKNRWGSCSSENNICFNWRMVMLSPAMIDYVIIHELSHLLEHNHSANFWRLVETIMPEYKLRRDELKKCSFILQLFR